jgi:hypothetical protein
MKLNFLLVLMVLVGTLSCRKEKASWESNWVFPLLNDELSIVNYLNDSTLGVNADNTVQVILQRDMLNLDIAGIVIIPDTTIEQTFSIQVPSLFVTPGLEYINQTEEHVFNLGDAVLFDMRLKSGKATVTVENPIETAAIFTVRLPGVSQNGVDFQQVEIVPGASGNSPASKTFDLDLSGYSVDLRGENGNLYNILQSQMLVQSDPNGSAVTITNSDVFKFSVAFSNMQVDYAKGYFGQQSISGNEIVNVDALRKIVDGGIQVDDVNFRLLFSNGIKLMAQGVFNSIESQNYTGDIMGLSHPDIGSMINIGPAQGTWSSWTPFERELDFNTGNSNIKDFLEHLGYRYYVDYLLNINPWGNVSGGTDEIFPNSRIKLRFEANFPLAIGADNFTIIDTFTVNLNQQSQATRIVTGELILRTENSFPFSAGVELELWSETGTIIGTIISPTNLTAATVAPSGDIHIPASDELVFSIPTSIVDNLQQVQSIVIKARFNSPELIGNSVFADDAIRMKLLTNFKLKTQL